ncbi:uncharacterized protein [Dysidea avara]|uniref:uncharacterized protein isoform X2 n=1 Tax=Dysidea avara TaxID=196820 RepID=UPI0033308884
MDEEETEIDYHSVQKCTIDTGHTMSDKNDVSIHTKLGKSDYLYGPQMIDGIMRKPEFSLLIRYYNLLYQSLMPNCKLTIKILKQHLEVSSDVESFIVNGESSRIRCQRIINLLLVQLDTTRDYKNFCNLFNMISVMTDLPDKLRKDPTHPPHPSRLITSSSVNQSDNYAVDNIVIRCVDDGPSDDRADNYSISSHHQVIDRRRSRLATTKSTTWTDTTTSSSDDHHLYTNSTPVSTDVSFTIPESISPPIAPLCTNGGVDDSLQATTSTDTTTTSGSISDGHHLLTNSTPVSTDVTEVSTDVSVSVTESISPPSSTGSGIGDESQALHLLRSKYDVIVQELPNDYEKTLQVVQDHLTDDQICDVLTSPNYTIANKAILNYLMEKVKCTANIVEFCDHLEAITSLLPDSRILTKLACELRGATSYKKSVGKERNPPQKIVMNEGFAQLKAHYHMILQLMPDNYEQSVGKLQNYISDDQICMILSSSNSTTANKIILDCLIERMSCREELLDLCGQIESISASEQLNTLIKEIRSEFVIPPQPTTTATNKSLGMNGITSSSGSHHLTTLHQTSNDSSVRIASTPVVSTLQLLPTAKQGIKCPPPPPLPPNHVGRQQLLDEMISKLLQSTIHPNSYGTSLTLTGAGGFGKTSIAIALCHHPIVKEQFTDGFVFIELGPQATDPSMKLSQLYHLLTGQYLKQGDINHAEQEINQLTSLYCRNLLVIIDDVWHVEDAEPIVKAFSNCKIVLTTRMNDIEHYIPTKQVVSVGPMEQSEAISLLTCGVIDISQLSQEDVSLLDELAQNVHLWPLLLSLIRGQFSYYLKRNHSQHKEAIQFIKNKLHEKGLSAFDKNNIDRSRKHAVKICINVTLELLSKSASDKMKTLILWTGVGTSLQTAVLHKLWKLSENEARDILDLLWAYGLVQIIADTTVTAHSLNTTDECVEVHAVISQYIMENMESKEVYILSPHGECRSARLVIAELARLSRRSYGVTSLASLSPTDYLKVTASTMENTLVPIYVKQINMYTSTDPHFAILKLKKIQHVLMTVQSITAFLPSCLEGIDSLISECHKTLNDVYRLIRNLNQNVQRYLWQKSYDDLIQVLEIYMDQYPVGLIARKAVITVKQALPYLDGEPLNFVTLKCEEIQAMTPECNFITLIILPYIKLHIKEIKDMNLALLAGSPNIETAYRYYTSSNYTKEKRSVISNYIVKLRKVVPKFAEVEASKFSLKLGNKV